MEKLLIMPTTSHCMVIRVKKRHDVSSARSTRARWCSSISETILVVSLTHVERKLRVQSGKTYCASFRAPLTLLAGSGNNARCSGERMRN